MDNLEVFDKDGNRLNIPDIVYSYIKDKAETFNKDIDKVYIGIDEFKKIWIETYEAVDNGYDAIDLNIFGKADEVNNKEITLKTIC